MLPRINNLPKGRQALWGWAAFQVSEPWELRNHQISIYVEHNWEMLRVMGNQKKAIGGLSLRNYLMTLGNHKETVEVPFHGYGKPYRNMLWNG